jgi:cobalt-zinc-cadmium efflux system protein
MSGAHNHHGHGHAAHHDHGHAQGHGAAPDPTGFGRAFAIGIALNLVFVAIEAGYGIVSNSMALLADAGHNLSDVLGLIIAWVAATLSRRQPTVRYTYGLRGSSILAALFNAMFLLVAVGAIVWEAIGRFANPEPVAGMTVIVVAGIGIIINTATALLFLRGRKQDLNIRGAFLHMAADAAVSAGVVLAGFGILQTGWLWLDPAISLVIAGIIIWSTWRLFMDSLAMSLGAVPAAIEPAKVRRYFQTLPGVARIHDLHIWPIGTNEVALTCHLVMPGGHPGDSFLMTTTAELTEHFAIGHPTLQIETSEETACALAPDEKV